MNHNPSKLFVKFTPNKIVVKDPLNFKLGRGYSVCCPGKFVKSAQYQRLVQKDMETLWNIDEFEDQEETNEARYQLEGGYS